MSADEEEGRWALGDADVGRSRASSSSYGLRGARTAYRERSNGTVVVSTTRCSLTLAALSRWIRRRQQRLTPSHPCECGCEACRFVPKVAVRFGAQGLL